MADRSNNFFNWIWRINSLLILAIGLVGVVGLVTLIVNTWLFASRESPSEGITEVAGTRIDDSDLNIGMFRKVKGTSMLFAELGTATDYLGSGSISKVANVRNVLFFDTGSKKAHWLLDENSAQIYRSQFLTDPPDCYDVAEERERCEANRRTVAILLELGPPRSEKPRSNSTRKVLVATPNGQSLKTLVEGVDAVLGVEAVSAKTVFVFYTKSGLVRFIQLDTKTRQLVSDEALGLGG